MEIQQFSCFVTVARKKEKRDRTRSSSIYVCLLELLFSIQPDVTRRNTKKFENIRENSKRENSCDHVSHRKHHFHPTMSVICIFRVAFISIFFSFFFCVFSIFLSFHCSQNQRRKLNNPRFSPPPLTSTSVFLFSNENTGWRIL